MSDTRLLLKILASVFLGAFLAWSSYSVFIGHSFAEYMGGVFIIAPTAAIYSSFLALPIILFIAWPWNHFLIKHNIRNLFVWIVPATVITTAYCYLLTINMSEHGYWAVYGPAGFFGSIGFCSSLIFWLLTFKKPTWQDLLYLKPNAKESG